jgi:hypothetical protein
MSSGRRQGCGDGGLLRPGLCQVGRRCHSIAETSIHKLHVLFGEAEVALCDPKSILCPRNGM